MSDDWLYKYSEAQANLENAQSRLSRLETLYNDIIEMTLNHDVVHSANGNDYASVSPKRISEALAKVNPRWYEERNV